jgi:hypothetical protein
MNQVEPTVENEVIDALAEFTKILEKGWLRGIAAEPIGKGELVYIGGDGHLRPIRRTTR